MVGEAAAVVAFRSAQVGVVPQPRRRSMIKSALANALALKVAAGAAAVAAAAGGVAYAANTGALSGTFGGGHAAAAAAASASARADAVRGSEGPQGAKGSPSPSLVGLCHAYTAGVATSNGKALENPAFTALITAAGGKAEVAGYCAKVLASARPSQAASGADHASKPSDRASEPVRATVTPSHPSR